MEEKQNLKKKNLLLFLGIAVLIFTIGGLTYAFFNYTKSGGSNLLKVGNIEFTSNYTGVTLANVFPIDSSEVDEDEDNVASVTLTVSGKTTYADGIEYLIGLVDVHNDLDLPISFQVTASNGLGTSDEEYFDNRGGDDKLYHVLASDTLVGDENIVVGYIPSSAETTSGTITIKAYFDDDLIGISDTYDGTGTGRMGSTNEWAGEKTIVTSDEWESLGENPVTFKIKVEGRNGIWVEDELGNTTNPQAANRFKVHSLYFTNDDVLELTNDKSIVKNLSVLIDGDEEQEFYAKIKLQGTSSLSYDKKNYTITFYTDDTYSKKLGVDVRHGWGDQSKYCLKANWIDSTQARNIVSARLASEMQAKYNLFMDTPNNGLVDGFFIEIYIYDDADQEYKYHGLYTMNIPKDEWMFNMDKNNPNHIVLSGENALQQTSTTFEALAPSIDGYDWSIEVGPNGTQEEVDAVFTKLNRLIAFVKDSTDEEFTNNITQYMNLDALINYYIFMALSTGVDNMNKNMLLVTYDGVIWYPSLYDLDATWGLYWGGNGLYNTNMRVTDFGGGSSLLFAKLVRCFPEQIQTRYNELRATVLSNEHIISEFTKFINSATQEMWDREHEKWTEIPSLSWGLSQISQNVVERGNYIDSKMIQLYHAPANYSDSRIIYKLESPYTGGVNKFLDTGVNLYKENESDQHATIVIKYKSDPSILNTNVISVLINNRSSDYENPSGLLLRNCFNGTDECATFWAGDYQYAGIYKQPSDTEYTIVVITQNGNVYDLYDNSVTNHQQVTSSVTHSVENNFVLGSNYYEKPDDQHITNPFSGTITDCIIYNEVLTTSEITSIFESLR